MAMAGLRDLASGDRFILYPHDRSPVRESSTSLTTSVSIEEVSAVIASTRCGRDPGTFRVIWIIPSIPVSCPPRKKITVDESEGGISRLIVTRDAFHTRSFESGIPFPGAAHDVPMDSTPRSHDHCYSDVCGKRKSGISLRGTLLSGQVGGTA